jgi:VWFA-related protein
VVRQSRQYLIFGLLIIGVTLWLSSEPLSLPQLQHQALAINIEVPVRVFKGDKFIDDLTLADFELYEDDVLQKIEAVYLIKKTTVSREERPKKPAALPQRFSPPTARHLVLIFELTEYFPRIREVVEYLFQKVVTPEDTLLVATPVKTYTLPTSAWQKRKREEITAELLSRIKKDLIWGNRDYQRLYKDIERMFSGYRDPADETWKIRYEMLLRKLLSFRFLDENQFRKFRDYLQDKEGQKYVFLFYQEEKIPVIPEVEELFFRELVSYTTMAAEIEKIKRLFAHSSIAINFIYLSPKKLRQLTPDALNPGSFKTVARSLDEVFTVFQGMAEATGGLVQTSANVAAAFQRAAEASENYYLLYYSPRNKAADGGLRRIKVKVKRPGCRVMYRLGYFANW